MVCFGLLIFVPIILLHLFIWYMTSKEPKLQNVMAENIPLPNGLSLRVYSRTNEKSDVNLVFIHGSPGMANAFNDQFENGFPKANLFAYDRPSYGGSTGGKKSLTLDAQVEALGYLLQAKRLTNCILIGHSYGGPIALQAAIAFPKRVRAAVLIGGSVDPAEERTILLQRFGNFPLVRVLIPRLVRSCNTELMALKTNLLDLQPLFSQLQVPVVMLHGSQDPLVPVENVAYLERQLTAVGKAGLFHKIILPEVNHFIPWEHPEAVQRAIAEAITASTIP